MLTSQQAEALMNASAAALDLHLFAEHKPGVVHYLVLASGMADLVMGQALGIEDESGAVFEPVAPRGPTA
ncbi:MAG: DUF4089 domain-containing protein [Piscinibacter sp.]|uniref:DUF4089 domain-containing protein n=1 Tax=Piscinibacter sp. TaxID=1903157 RepID=UPI00258DF284|nr:DUF4089 domain-containing protein [Piscinibacter sp.]MCW5664908.1 DUF4089 domain-containing protein [Piscinibacter sp.]